MKRKHGVFFGFAVLLIAVIFTLAGCGDSGSGDPTVPSEDPAVPDNDHTVPGEDPAVPGDDPTVPGEDPAVPGNPVITITTQPANRSVIEGSIDDYITVEAAVTAEAALTYQWYSSAGGSNTGGTAVSEGNYNFFSIPADLTEGTYYYFCEVSAAGAASVKSNVATVTVRPMPTGDVSKISLTGFPPGYEIYYITIRLYTDGSGLGGVDPRYSGLVAETDATISYDGDMTDRPLLAPYSLSSSSLNRISLPATGSYYITVHLQDPGGGGYAQWGTTRKLNIAYPIEYESGVFRWKKL